ncbi:type IV pilus modification PilV family protein [Deinococcus koreensis]|uniref:Prepilin-type cleavage/methylation domain-containing protein n=1 Tax=Deinococcus koreensis TaxID=2054903 RepID=A0A2K3V1L7_9DEIO|nr:prepilin-type N-terminal cleavage/methylation domain-containing protein [Deinococcus koreensis]PNY82668.1 hypothetical protein CVO96_16095 [Deinococcus koreensis]
MTGPASRQSQSAARPPARQGFTLPEVLMAIVVLVVGILVVAGMQSASLRASHQASEAQQATALVRSKIEGLRAQPATLSTRCVSGEVVGAFTLNCTPIPCTLNAAADLNCAVGLSTPVAYRIDLRIERTPDAREILSVVTVIAL